MNSLVPRIFFRSVGSRSRRQTIVSNKNEASVGHSLFNYKYVSASKLAVSRSWFIRKSAPTISVHDSRNFSTFFFPREEQKSGSCCHKHNAATPQQTVHEIPKQDTTVHIHHTHHSHKPPSATEMLFWQDPSVWRRASSNTLRCLVGCSIGDFSAMFYLQAHHVGLPFLAMMAIPMASGIATSLSLETLVLRIKEKMSWNQSLKTAWTMSLISMLTMEFVENIVDMYLTKGMMNFHDPYFWLALGPSLLAGFLAPLPYNYYKLKKFGQSCH